MKLKRSAQGSFAALFCFKPISLLASPALRSNESEDWGQGSIGGDCGG